MRNLSSGVPPILYLGTRALEKLVHRPGALILHVLKDVRVAPEGHGQVGVAEHL
jgi:hypothetical protein